MNAAPEIQLRLLDLQDLDSTVDRLAQRRRTLPELAALAEAETQLREARDAVVRAETEVSDLSREQTRAENDVDVVRTRRERDEQRLASGSASPKELESLQHEVGSLQRRQSDLEDTVLEVMERREVAENALTTARGDVATLEDRIADLTSRRDAAFTEIDAESQQATTQRAAVAAGLPADLVTLYEKVRGNSGGVGAAKLFRGRCEGCHLGLSSTDLQRIKAAPEDSVIRCEECSRILVRTPDSGL